MRFGSESNDPLVHGDSPMPIQIAHQLARQLAQVRKAGVVGYLGPDGKTQVTVRYERDRPVEVEKVLISTQHKPEAGEQMIRNDLWEHVLEPVLHAEYKELFTEGKLLFQSEGAEVYFRRIELRPLD